MNRQNRLLLAVIIGAACIGDLVAARLTQDDALQAGETRILVFSKTAGFRHDSIPAGIDAIKSLARENGFAVDATEDAAAFTSENLMQYDVVVFLNTTGDVLDEQQQAAFEAFIRNGRGFVGIHAAADTEYDWPWYGRLVGTRFASHPAIQPAIIDVLDHDHLSTRHLSDRWHRTDEWYNFNAHPRKELGDRLRVLASIDETTYEGGTMPDGHPVAWCHEFEGGRAWYTVGGHTSESFSEQEFLRHILGGIQWAARITPAPTSPPQPLQPSPKPSSIPFEPPPPPQPAVVVPSTTRTVGDIAYRGESTWRGVIEVGSDSIAFENGTITVVGSGIPQGVTFHGDRQLVALRNLKFIGVGDGINSGNNVRPANILIENCQFLDCRTPDADAKDHLLCSRGVGIFIGAGRNWTIRNSVFRLKTRDPSKPDQRDCGTQYAGRFGDVNGLFVSDTRFENWAGKATLWFMFVRNAVWENVEISGGPVRIGARPTDLAGIERGDCRNITFQNCSFEFGVFHNWPASILIWPGSENINFVNCQITTDPDCEWWIDIDTRGTSNVRWKNCTWNGKLIEGYAGVRTKLTQEQMIARKIGPANETPQAASPKPLR